MTSVRRSPGRFAYLGDRERDLDICRRASILTDRIVLTEDGRELVARTAGRAGLPVVALVSPLGVSCLFFIKLVEALAQHHHVVTWETRGLPYYYPDAVARPGEWDPDTHVRDLRAVLAAECQGRVDFVISYCSGSYLTLHATAGGWIAPRRAALISPPLELDADGGKTLYQKTFPPLLSRIARSGLPMATLVRRIMRQSAERAQTDADRELHLLNDLPFDSDEHFYRYACLHAPWRAMPWLDALRSISAPTAIFHGTDDDIVHPDTVAALAAAIPGARLRLYEGQGHFALYASDELIQDVVRFVTANESYPAVSPSVLS